MTKEELKQEAEESLKQSVLDFIDERFRNEITERRCQAFFTYSELSNALLDFAEPREKRIEELEQQIEKMKCCYNCSKWNDGECEESPKSKTFFCADFKCDKWECIE